MVKEVSVEAMAGSSSDYYYSASPLKAGETRQPGVVREHGLRCRVTRARPPYSPRPPFHDYRGRCPGDTHTGGPGHSQPGPGRGGQRRYLCQRADHIPSSRAITRIIHRHRFQERHYGGTGIFHSRGYLAGNPDDEFSQPEALSLDVLFLLDTTSSMDDEIQQIKSALLSIADQVGSLESNADLRFGMVAYRTE